MRKQGTGTRIREARNLLFPKYYWCGILIPGLKTQSKPGSDHQIRIQIKSSMLNKRLDYSFWNQVLKRKLERSTNHFFSIKGESLKLEGEEQQKISP